MFTIYQIKPAFQSVLRPLVGFLARIGVTANQVTILAMVVSILLGLILSVSNYHPYFFALPIWCFLRMALNAIDGMLAREHGQKSTLGAYLNEIGDVVSDAALFLPFALLDESMTFPVFLVIWLSALSEISGIMGAVVGSSRRYDGPMGKSDRAFLLGILGVWYGFYGTFPEAFLYLLWVVSFLILVNIIIRTKKGRE